MEAVGRFSWRTVLEEHERKLERTAHYDALTGLPNRVLLADRLHQAGVTQFTFASAHDHARDLGRLGGYTPAPGRTETVGVWRIYVMNAASTGG